MKTELEVVTDLLDRFVELYGEVPLQGSMQKPGMQLWRDYYEWTGELIPRLRAIVEDK